MNNYDQMISKKYQLSISETEYYIQKMGMRVEENGMNEDKACDMTIGEILRERKK